MIVNSVEYELALLFTLKVFVIQTVLINPFNSFMMGAVIIYKPLHICKFLYDRVKANVPYLYTLKNPLFSIRVKVWPVRYFLDRFSDFFLLRAKINFMKVLLI